MTGFSMPLNRLLARAAVISRYSAALLVAAVSVRFAVASFGRVSEGPPAAAPAPSSPPVVERPASTLVRPLPSRRVPPPSPSAGRPRIIQLGVSVGEGRSEIYVNGRLVGHTPFVGDTSCKTGLPLRIELVPPSGPPLVYERKCLGAIIEISTPPP